MHLIHSLFIIIRTEFNLSHAQKEPLLTTLNLALPELPALITSLYMQFVVWPAGEEQLI